MLSKRPAGMDFNASQPEKVPEKEMTFGLWANRFSGMEVSAVQSQKVRLK